MNRRRVGARGAFFISAIAVSAACSGSEREFRSEPLGTAASALDSGIAAPQVLLNEIEVNPSDKDRPYEYVELRGTPGASLQNVYFLTIDAKYTPGDAGTSPAGTVDLLVNFSSACGAEACRLGSDGLLYLGSDAGHSVPSGTTLVHSTLFDVSDAGGGALDNDSHSYVVVWSPLPLSESVDYDANDDGTLELPAGAKILDGVAWLDQPEYKAYAPAVLAVTGNAPDVATRRSGSTATEASAWYFGDLAGKASSSVTYQVGLHVPIGGYLTPGSENFDAHDGGTAGSGGAAGSTSSGGAGGIAGSGGAAGTTSSGGVAGTAGSSGGVAGTAGSSGGVAGTAGTGGAAGSTSSGGSAGASGGAAGASGGSGAAGGSAGTSTGGSAGASTGGRDAAAAGSGGTAGTGTAGADAGGADAGGADAGGADAGGADAGGGSGGSVSSAGTAGTTATGGTSGSSGAAGTETSGNPSNDDSGCSCSTPKSKHAPTGLLALFSALVLVGVRRKRRTPH